MNPKISIIIPIYNGEKTIKKCLDSVCAQSLFDIEIICVNDGSSDGTSCILRDYSDNDKRIKVISTGHLGGTAARKRGLDIATAEYIGFVDADDWIDECMYERLYDIVCKFHPQMVCSGYKVEGSYTSMNADSIEEGLYQDDEIKAILNQAIYNTERMTVGIRGALWCKLFDRNLIKKALYQIPDEVTYSEDKLCVLTFLLDCNSIYVTHEGYYHYCINNNSLTHEGNINYLEKVNAIYNYFFKLYGHPNFTNFMRMQAELYITELLYLGINSRLGFANKNLFWLDKDYLNKIQYGSKIVLLGDGELLDTYKRQLEVRGDIQIIGQVGIGEVGQIKGFDFDSILITIKNGKVAEGLKERLIKNGIDDKKILWFEQKEIFWEYAKINGWI